MLNGCFALEKALTSGRTVVDFRCRLKSRDRPRPTLQVLLILRLSCKLIHTVGSISSGRLASRHAKTLSDYHKYSNHMHVILHATFSHDDISTDRPDATAQWL